ncbi:universal stress protein [Streptomyces sp. LP11]|uniref:Universal stress protein n=1 Tax=Streptomyces pyxinicus TaxID=2970331 RepID=A0ABT2B6R6_9ACTN|nr:universal stress protein [Streptomyces sp. LP11]MCS0604212.1 universal stress protein [Streptomyces sp. LP11]
MSRTVTVGLDGSPESRTAADWAAREARLRGLPLRLVHVWEPVPGPMAQAPLLGAETHRHWTERIPREAAAELRTAHPGLEIRTEQLDGASAAVLAEAAEESELLVLGSRGLSGIGGFLVGSVGLSVVAHAGRPVVLVRAGERAADEHEPDTAGTPSERTPFRPVVLGVDTAAPHDALFAFAFEEAVRRETSVRAVRAWNMPPYYVYGFAADPTLDQEIAAQEKAALSEVLKPWRHKYPSVEVVEECEFASPSLRMIEAARDASLVVVGRRRRPAGYGTHVGPVTHAVLHHSAAPVAVVPHD